MKDYYYDARETKIQYENKIVAVLFIPKYDFATYHSNFINKANLEVIKCITKYNSSTKSDINLAIVKDKKTNLYGLFSYSKQEHKCIIPIEFDYIEFNYSLGFTIKKNNLCGLYSSTGTPIVPIIFDSFTIEGNLIIVKKDGLVGLYSSSGSLILPANFFNIIIKGDLIIVEENEHFSKGIYSISLSKFIIPIKYNNIEILSDYIIAITCIDRYKAEESYYDFSGKFIKSEVKEESPEYDRSDILEGIYMGWW